MAEREIIEFNGVRFEADWGTLSYGEKSTRIPLQLGFLFKLLVVNNRPLSKSFLIDSIWDDVHYSRPGSGMLSLRVLLASLRRKMREIDAPVEIKTSVGYGVRLICTKDA